MCWAVAFPADRCLGIHRVEMIDSLEWPLGERFSRSLGPYRWGQARQRSFGTHFTAYGRLSGWTYFWLRLQNGQRGVCHLVPWHSCSLILVGVLGHQAFCGGVWQYMTIWYDIYIYTYDMYDMYDQHQKGFDAIHWRSLQFLFSRWISKVCQHEAKLSADFLTFDSCPALFAIFVAGKSWWRMVTPSWPRCTHPPAMPFPCLMTSWCCRQIFPDDLVELEMISRNSS